MNENYENYKDDGNNYSDYNENFNLNYKNEIDDSYEDKTYEGNEDYYSKDDYYYDEDYYKDYNYSYCDENNNDEYYKKIIRKDIIIKTVLIIIMNLPINSEIIIIIEEKDRVKISYSKWRCKHIYKNKGILFFCI